MADEEYKTEKQLVRGLRTEIADKLLKEFNVGEVVPHKWIQDEVGLSFQNVDTMENHTLFRKTYGSHQSAILHLVRERGGRLLVSVKPKGYLLVNPKDHFSLSASKSIRAVLREHTRLEKSLDCIDYELLEAEGIGHNHPQLVSDRESRAWIDHWITLLFAEGRPEGISKIAADALEGMNKAEVARYL